MYIGGFVVFDASTHLAIANACQIATRNIPLDEIKLFQIVSVHLSDTIDIQIKSTMNKQTKLFLSGAEMRSMTDILSLLYEHPLLQESFNYLSPVHRYTALLQECFDGRYQIFYTSAHSDSNDSMPLIRLVESINLELKLYTSGYDDLLFGYICDYTVSCIYHQLLPDVSTTSLSFSLKNSLVCIILYRLIFRTFLSCTVRSVNYSAFAKILISEFRQDLK